MIIAKADEINKVLFTTVEWVTVCEESGFAAVDSPTIDHLE